MTEPGDFLAENPLYTELVEKDFEDLSGSISHGTRNVRLQISYSNEETFQKEEVPCFKDLRLQISYTDKEPTLELIQTCTIEEAYTLITDSLLVIQKVENSSKNVKKRPFIELIGACTFREAEALLKFCLIMALDALNDSFFNNA